jgi:hypothetical protein
MDTISRENNSNYLPIAGVLVGVIALVLSAVALFKASSGTRALGDKIDSVTTRVDTIESTANSAAQTAQTANAAITKMQSSVQGAFDQIGTKFGSIDAAITKLQETAKPAPRVQRPARFPPMAPTP